MSTIASLRIEEWGGKYVVQGEFQGHSAISRQVFDTYKEALNELSRMARREEIRYEFYDSRDLRR